MTGLMTAIRDENEHSTLLPLSPPLSVSETYAYNTIEESHANVDLNND
jgi:hypothetical protein